MSFGEIMFWILTTSATILLFLIIKGLLEW